MAKEDALLNVELISKYRLQLVNRFCSRYRSKNTPLDGQYSSQHQTENSTYLLTQKFKRRIDHHLTYNDRYKYIECRVPKTGTSRRGRFMWTLNHNETAFNEAKYVHPFRDKYVTLLKGLSVDDIRTKLDSYTKFLFVRDPISRFISGYIGKIRSQKLDYLNSVKKARIAANETDQNKPLSFRAFAEYVATLADRGRHIRNAHFSGCLNFCEVCFVNYSFIGKNLAI